LQRRLAGMRAARADHISEESGARQPAQTHPPNKAKRLNNISGNTPPAAR
jgi:hypothetical protein